MTAIATQALPPRTGGEYHLKYRPDIDGLRAIAVLSVVIYHLGLGILPGGFVGVDVFFVISGYLISKIIYAETSAGTFTLKSFYTRRSRRIIPGLLSVLLMCSAFAYWTLYPSELVEFSKSLLATLIFSSNIYFYSTLSYFSQSAESAPLLHLWSLGIEEQFYIFFPLAVIALTKFNKKYLSTALAVILIASAIASSLLLRTDPSASFYLLPFRAFELLIGSMLALPSIRSTLSARSASVAALVGLLLILLPIFAYDDSIAFPGAAALLPCIGAALVIYAGRTSNGFSGVLLGNEKLAVIGKLSYSLYLVHWPIIVFGKKLFPFANPYSFGAAALTLSLALAYANCRFVELPFRHGVLSRRPSAILVASLPFAIVLSGVALLIILKSGFIEAEDVRTQKALAYMTYKSNEQFRTGTCFLTAEQDPQQVDLSSCLPGGTGQKVILWGDSHATQYFYGLSRTLPPLGYSLGFLTAQSCPPIMGVTVKSNPRCAAFNEVALPIILQQKPDIVILAANWVVLNPEMNLLEKTLQRFSGTGIKLVMLGQSPIYDVYVPTLIADRIKAGDKEFLSTKELAHKFLDRSKRVMTQRFGSRTDVKYISVMDVMCPNYACQLVAPDGTPMVFDVAHLTKEGSIIFAQKLTPLIIE